MPTAATSSTTAVGKSTLDQADYLKLLVTQLTSQNPLNPQSDTAFASELAQFSALQETQALGNNVQSLQANALIGQTVALQSNSDSTATDVGVVSSVQMVSGVPELVVNGNLYKMNQLQAITGTTAATNNGTVASSTGATPVNGNPTTGSSTTSNSTGNSSGF